MYAFQIRAGNEPPVIEFKPPIPVNFCSGVSRKKATAVAKSGEYPANQAEALSCDVPVLPAIGRGNPANTDEAVPLRTTPDNEYDKSAITFSENTLLLSPLNS